MSFKKLFISFSLLTFTFLNVIQASNAQSLPYDQNDEEILTVRVTQIIDESTSNFDGREYVTQDLESIVIEGSLKGETITVRSAPLPVYKEGKYEVHDTLLVGYLTGVIGEDYFYIISHQRTDATFILFGIFLVLTLLVARKKGLKALLAMVASFVVIFTFIIPFITNGYNPVLISICGSLFIIPLIFYLSHGLNKKTSIAILGTLVALIFTSILAKVFVEATHLSGLVYEEVEALLYAKEGTINLRGLLIAGIIIGTLGILDDVSISQSSIVKQLREVAPKIQFKELYTRSMSVGTDHISSVINTLILVYTGSSLSTLLLFTEFPRPLSVILNNEVVVIQVVVALIGSIGIILTVPLTTFFACLYYTKNLHR